MRQIASFGNDLSNMINQTTSTSPHTYTSSISQSFFPAHPPTTHAPCDTKGRKGFGAVPKIMLCYRTASLGALEVGLSLGLVWASTFLSGWKGGGKRDESGKIVTPFRLYPQKSTEEKEFNSFPASKRDCIHPYIGEL